MLMVVVLISAAGCAGVISLKNSKDVDRTVTPALVRESPDEYIGTKVIWGGIIVSIKDINGRTVIEVLNAPLDQRGRVQGATMKDNRFLIDVADYLDPFVYRSGMEIVSAGRIKGIRIKALEGTNYPYPVLETVELHIFEAR